MSWWNAKYTNGDADNEITFGSKYYERAKAVEKVCQAVIDKKVKTPDDVAVVVRCKGCKHYDMGVCLKIYSDGNVHSAAWQSRKPDDFCSYGERKEGADNGCEISIEEFGPGVIPEVTKPEGERYRYSIPTWLPGDGGPGGRGHELEIDVFHVGGGGDAEG